MRPLEKWFHCQPWLLLNVPDSLMPLSLLRLTLPRCHCSTATTAATAAAAAADDLLHCRPCRHKPHYPGPEPGSRPRGLQGPGWSINHGARISPRLSGDDVPHPILSRIKVGGQSMASREGDYGVTLLVIWYPKADGTLISPYCFRAVGCF